MMYWFENFLLGGYKMSKRDANRFGTGQGPYNDNLRLPQTDPDRMVESKPAQYHYLLLGLFSILTFLVILYIIFVVQKS